LAVSEAARLLFFSDFSGDMTGLFGKTISSRPLLPRLKRDSFASADPELLRESSGGEKGCSGDGGSSAWCSCVSLLRKSNINNIFINSEAFVFYGCLEFTEESNALPLVIE
jgi:hypothetical protein